MMYGNGGCILWLSVSPEEQQSGPGGGQTSEDTDVKQGV